MSFRSNREVSSSKVSKGYLLPAVIALGLGTSTISIMALTTVAHNSATLSSQHYSTLAREAAQSGVTAVGSCLAEGIYSWTDTNPLEPQDNCNGAPDPSRSETIIDKPDFSSAYAVKELDINTVDNTVLVTSTGIVNVKGPSGTAKTITETVRTFAKSERVVSTRISKDVSQISTGPSQACALAEGWVYCWGDNSDGSLGIGRYTADGEQAIPTRIADNPATQAPIPGTCTFYFGGCHAWNPPTTPQQDQSPIANKIITKLSVGKTHSCVIATEHNGSNGRAYCWGANNKGQLGSGSMDASIMPVAVDTRDTFTYTGAKECHGTEIGSWCSSGWVYPTVTRPASSLLNKTVVDISAGNGFTCVRTSDYRVHCWGDNSDGQLGNGTRTSTNYPVAVNMNGALSGKRVAKLAKLKNGASTMCVITDNEAGYCWGKSDVGQTGSGGTIAASGSGRAEKRHGNPNQCNPLRQDVLMSAKSQAGPPHEDTDELTPVLVAGGNKFKSITVNDSGTRGNSFESISAGTGTNPNISEGESFSYVTALSSSNSEQPNRVYWWGGERSFRATVDCYRNGDTYGGDHSKATASISRSYSGSTSPNGPLYNNASGTTLNGKQILVASGNAYNNLFCALAGTDLYCDRHSSSALQGQLGNGWKCTNIITAFCSQPSGPQRVTMTGWLAGKTIEDIDTGSDYTCVIARSATGREVGCWGDNYRGRLGTNAPANSYEPTPVNIDESSDLGKGGGSGASSDKRTFENPINF